MAKDPIVEDVRATREKLFEACNDDLNAFLKLLKDQEQQDRSRLVSPKDLKARRKAGGSSSRQPKDPAGRKPVRARKP